MSPASPFHPVAHGGDPAPVLQGVTASLRLTLAAPQAEALPPRVDAALGRLRASASPRPDDPPGSAAP